MNLLEIEALSSSCNTSWFNSCPRFCQEEEFANGCSTILGDYSSGVHLIHCLTLAKLCPLCVPIRKHFTGTEYLLAEPHYGMDSWLFILGSFSLDLELTLPMEHNCAHLQSHHISHQDGENGWWHTFRSCAILVTLPGHLSIKQRGHYIWEYLPMRSSLPAHKKQSDAHFMTSTASKCNSCYNSWQTKAELTAHPATGSPAGAFLHQLLLDG